MSSTHHSSSSPPSKRRREEENAPVFKRSNLWFSDGNIALQAEDTQFCVHRSVLSKYSSVFRDMFSLPQSSADMVDEQVDGIPVVILHDMANDVERMIANMYGGRDLFDGKLGGTEELSHALRMGLKYHIEHFTESAKKRILVDFSPECQDWNKGIREESPDRRTQSSRAFTIDVLELIEQYGVDEAKPAAYLDMAFHNLDTIVCGIKDKSGCMHTLSPNIIKRVLMARECIIKSQAEAIGTWNGTCENNCYRCERRVMASEMEMELPSYTLFSPQWKEGYGYDLCENCDMGIDATIGCANMATVWDRLSKALRL